MATLNYKCTLVTPMFMGGADNRKAELRPPSIKGVLRFWWRALQPGLNIDVMRQNEQLLFGGVMNGAVRSKVILSITSSQLTNDMSKLPSHPAPVEGKTFTINILEYLAYGTFDYIKGQGNIMTKERLKPGGKFELELVCPENEKSMIDELVSVAFSFGGLGSKSHNGYGSIDVDAKTNSIESLYKKMKSLYGNIPLPAYQSFSSGMKFWRTKDSGTTWDGSLALLARAYRQARSSIEPRHSFTRRQFIGSPLIENKVSHSFLERHAKPYFMGVHSDGNNQYRGYLLYLPSQYAPGIAAEHQNAPVPPNNWDQQFAAACVALNNGLANALGPDNQRLLEEVQ